MQQINLTTGDTGILFLLNFAFGLSYRSSPFHNVLTACSLNGIQDLKSKESAILDQGNLPQSSLLLENKDSSSTNF